MRIKDARSSLSSIGLHHGDFDKLASVSCSFSGDATGATAQPCGERRQMPRAKMKNRHLNTDVLFAISIRSVLSKKEIRG
jgi:hypothetical protein